LSASTAKRAVLYRFDRQPVEGVVNPQAYLMREGIDFLTLTGNLQRIPYTETKALCFVADVAKWDLFMDHPLFERRPKVPGLWTRFTLRDGDQLDGILSHSLLDWPAEGFLITPPRAGVGRQRVFLPRASLAGTELRGVVGVSSHAGSKAADTAKAAGQINMFE
jgi:hypothetical protein